MSTSPASAVLFIHDGTAVEDSQKFSDRWGAPESIALLICIPVAASG